MIRRISLVAITAIALACATPQGSDRNEDGLRDTAAGRFGGALGSSPVGVIPDVVVRDDARGRDIRISIEYPTRGEKQPVLLFSPAYGASNQDYVGLSASWASNGYIVIRASHADLGRPREDNFAASQTATDWRNRVRDLTFLIDSLSSLEQRFPELAGKMDATRIGVAGHGYGGHTAMLAGGVRTFPGGVSYADPRIKAVVVMSPVGSGEARGLTRDSWSELRVPTLFMTGTRETSAIESETPEWRREGYLLAPAGDKWLVTLEGARESSFTGRMRDVIESIRVEEQRRATNDVIRDNQIPVETGRSRVTLSANEREIFNRVKGLSLAFWDTYLRADSKGRAALEATTPGATIEKR